MKFLSLLSLFCSAGIALAQPRVSPGVYPAPGSVTPIGLSSNAVYQMIILYGGTGPTNGLTGAQVTNSIQNNAILKLNGTGTNTVLHNSVLRYPDGVASFPALTTYDGSMRLEVEDDGTQNGFHVFGGDFYLEQESPNTIVSLDGNRQLQSTALSSDFTFDGTTLSLSPTASGGISKTNGFGTNTTFFTGDNIPSATVAATTFRPLEVSTNPGASAMTREIYPTYTNSIAGGFKGKWREVITAQTNTLGDLLPDVIYQFGYNANGDNTGTSTYGLTDTNEPNWTEQWESRWQNLGSLSQLEVWKSTGTPYTQWGTNQQHRYFGYNKYWDTTNKTFVNDDAAFVVGSFKFFNTTRPVDLAGFEINFSPNSVHAELLTRGVLHTKTNSANNGGIVLDGGAANFLDASGTRGVLSIAPVTVLSPTFIRFSSDYGGEAFGKEFSGATFSRFMGKTSTNVPLEVIGASSQSTNLFEIKNSSGVVLAYVTSAGVWSGNGGGLTNVSGTGGGGGVTNPIVLGTSKITSGQNDPEGSYVGSPGDIFLRTNGGVGTVFYTKETGTGNTGWARNGLAPVVKAGSNVTVGTNTAGSAVEYTVNSTGGGSSNGVSYLNYPAVGTYGNDAVWIKNTNGSLSFASSNGVPTMYDDNNHRIIYSDQISGSIFSGYQAGALAQDNKIAFEATPGARTIRNNNGDAFNYFAVFDTYNQMKLGDYTYDNTQYDDGGVLYRSGNTIKATTNLNLITGPRTNLVVWANAAPAITAIPYTNFPGVAVVNQSGISNTTGAGVLISNSIAATVNQQQNSGTLDLVGNGWKTTATAGSQPVKWSIGTAPIQGTTAPTGDLVFSNSVNNATPTLGMRLTSIGTLMVNGNLNAANGTITVGSSASAIAIGNHSRVSTATGQIFAITDASGGNTMGLNVSNVNALGTLTSNNGVIAGPRTYVNSFVGTKTLVESNATALVSISLPTSMNTMGCTIRVTVHSDDGSKYQSRSETLYVDAGNEGGTVTSNGGLQDVNASSTRVSPSGGGTIDVALTATISGTTVLINCNAGSSLTQTTLRADWQITSLNASGSPAVVAQ